MGSHLGIYLSKFFFDLLGFGARVVGGGAFFAVAFLKHFYLRFFSSIITLCAFRVLSLAFLYSLIFLFFSFFFFFLLISFQTVTIHISSLRWSWLFVFSIIFTHPPTSLGLYWSVSSSRSCVSVSSLHRAFSLCLFKARWLCTGAGWSTAFARSTQEGISALLVRPNI